MKLKLLFLVVGVVTFFSFQSTSYAQVRFTASLNTAQAIPSPNVMGTPTGTAVATLTGNATDGFALRYDITVTGLSGPIRAGQLHQKSAGEAGNVVKEITFTDNTASGVWRTSDAMQPLTVELVQALINGDLYVNIPTPANMAGEIRGQLWPMKSFVARLDVAQASPAPNVMGRPVGTAYLILRGRSDGRIELSFDLTVDGLSGPIQGAHFHRQNPGMTTGSIVKSIQADFMENTASGVWRSGVQTQPLTPDLLKALLNGELYLDVHTMANPLGEIHGQVIPE